MTIPVTHAIAYALQVLNDFLANILKSADSSTDSTSTAVILKSKSLLMSSPISQPPVKPFETPFLGLSPSEVLSIFQELVAPFDDGPSFWSSSCFIILDEQTARDRTCLIVSNALGKVETRRSEFGVVMYHVVPVEMLHLDLTQCGQISGVVDATLSALMIHKEMDEYEVVKANGTVARTPQ